MPQLAGPPSSPRSASDVNPLRILFARRVAEVLTFLASLALTTASPAATLILNEYNAVSSSNWLNGGDGLADDDGGMAADLTFGRIQGNGGDWFELVLTENGVDLRGWQLEIYVNGSLDTTLVLSQNPLWTQLQAGTIITVSEDQAEDLSYDPLAGDWTINVQANDGASGAYVTASNFPVDENDWQLVIRDDQGATVFGPSGEGTVATGGVNSREIWRLEEDPSASIVEGSLCFDDADTHSSWGLPNVWSSGTKTQNFGSLRTGTAPTSQCDGSDLTPMAFDPDHLLDVGVAIDPADWEILRRQQVGVMEVFGGACGLDPPPDPYTFFSADVTVDGTLVANAGIRKKGFFGSVDRQKPSLKIDFGEFGSETRVYGMERLTLNNGRQDPSLLDQCLSYGLYRAAGLVGFALQLRTRHGERGGPRHLHERREHQGALPGAELRRLDGQSLRGDDGRLSPILDRRVRKEEQRGRFRARGREGRTRDCGRRTGPRRAPGHHRLRQVSDLLGARRAHRQLGRLRGEREQLLDLRQPEYPPARVLPLEPGRRLRAGQSIREPGSQLGGANGLRSVCDHPSTAGRCRPFGCSTKHG